MVGTDKSWKPSVKQAKAQKKLSVLGNMKYNLIRGQSENLLVWTGQTFI